MNSPGSSFCLFQPQWAFREETGARVISLSKWLRSTCCPPVALPSRPAHALQPSPMILKLGIFLINATYGWLARKAARERGARERLVMLSIFQITITEETYWHSRQALLQLVVPFQSTILSASKPFQKCCKDTPGRTKNDCNLYEKLYEVGAFGGYINTLEKKHSKCTKRVKWIACFIFFFFILWQLPTNRAVYLKKEVTYGEKIQIKGKWDLIMRPVQTLLLVWSFFISVTSVSFILHPLRRRSTCCHPSGAHCSHRRSKPGGKQLLHTVLLGPNN